MGKRMVEVVCLAVGLLMSIPAAAQKEEPQPKQGDGIAEALRNNPDVLVARAKLALAQAELERVNLNTVMSLATLRAEIDTQQSRMEFARRKFARLNAMHESGVVTETELIEAEKELLEARAGLERTQQQLKAMSGEVAQGATATKCEWTWIPLTPRSVELNSMVLTPESFELFRNVEGSSIDVKLAAHLDRRIQIEQAVERPINELVEYLRTRSEPRVPLRLLLVKDYPPIEVPDLELTLGAWLIWITDAHPDLEVVVRPYGLLITDRPPTDAVRFSQVWPKPTKPTKPNQEP